MYFPEVHSFFSLLLENDAFLMECEALKVLHIYLYLFKATCIYLFIFNQIEHITSVLQKGDLRFL